jgi:hypothetical protein
MEQGLEIMKGFRGILVSVEPFVAFLKGKYKWS